MNSPALQWLSADFEQGLQRYKRKLRYGALDRHWQGPIAIRPMIQLRSPLSPLRTHARHPRRLPRPGPVVAMTLPDSFSDDEPADDQDSPGASGTDQRPFTVTQQNGHYEIVCNYCGQAWVL